MAITVTDIPISEILQAYFTQTSIAVFSDPSTGKPWPLYISSIPDENGVYDEAAMISDTAPIKDSRCMTGENRIKFGIQLMVRAKVNRYTKGWQKMEEARLTLEQIKYVDVVVNTITYTIINVTQTSGITFLGAEEGTKRRQLFTLNLLITLK